MSISANTTYITANQRLAQHLRQNRAQKLPSSHSIIAESSDYLPLESWITHHYRVLKDERLLLSAHQELAIWENIIQHSLSRMNLNWALFSTREIAAKVRDAWHLMKNWQLPLTALTASDLQETKAFYQWSLTFEKTCRERNWIDFSTGTDVVIKAVAQQTLSLPNKIILIGFLDIPPQIKHLFNALAEKCSLQSYDALPLKISNFKQKTSHSISPDNEETELVAMAHWAYQRHVENPHHTIGCIVPHLSEHRSVLERIFSDVFQSADTFSLGGGFSLHHFPLIQTAFDLLKLSGTAFDANVISRLLVSPFLVGAEQEMAARALLDVALRDALEPQLDWQRLFLTTSAQNNCPIWLEQCKQYWQHFQAEPQQQNVTAWHQYFSKQLNVMGWPGERTLDDRESQQLQRWELLLDEFDELDLVLDKPLSLSQALHYLLQLAKNTVFHPQLSNAFPVRILGLLDAIGLPFDDLWVANMTNEDWPPPLSPNPFIPLHLQRSYHMPKASPERELKYSRALIQHFRENSFSIIFSYALYKEDRLQSPSALISDIPQISVALKEYGSFPMTNHETTEKQEDNNGPILQANETLHGSGANLFKHQAACPFKAFAQIRLAAKQMPVFVNNITRQERGIYVHAILERVWKRLKNHQTLCQHTEKSLDILLQSIIDEVLDKFARKRSFALKPQFAALEKKRLFGKIKAWLALEKKRMPFQVIALEKITDTQFAGIPLRLRVDRVDELEDGTRIVIDYKTGKCHPADWFGERPDDPQLPLYALIQHAIKGLAFAQLSADSLQFKGISEQPNIIPGIISLNQQKYDNVTTWDEFYKRSELNLAHLAKEFLDGYAKVNPKNGSKTCLFCDLKPLCRINEK